MLKCSILQDCLWDFSRSQSSRPTGNYSSSAPIIQLFCCKKIQGGEWDKLVFFSSYMFGIWPPILHIQLAKRTTANMGQVHPDGNEQFYLEHTYLCQVLEINWAQWNWTALNLLFFVSTFHPIQIPVD